MATATTDTIYGQDIALDLTTLDALVAVDGSLVLTDGPDTGVQDIMLRLRIFLGSLFFDKLFGSLCPWWIREDNTEANRLGFAQEVKKRVQLDPRVVPTSVACSVTAWDEKGITALVSWTFIDETHTRNLVLVVGVDNDVLIEEVVADVDSGE